HICQGRVRMFVQERLARDNEARRAKSALLGIVFHECGLYRRQVAAGRKSFDSGNLFTLSFDGEHRAGVDCLAPHDYRTGSARRPVTDLLRSGVVERVAQSVKERYARLDAQALPCTV